jgi:hypothetical protein
LEKNNSLTMTFDQLKQFRLGVYTLLGNGKDALFDLMDAVKRHAQCLLVCGVVSITSVSAAVAEHL